MTEFTESDWLKWVFIPLFIFLARVSDVSLDTIRIINVNGNNRWTATILGFFQVMIWLLAVQQIMQNLNNFLYYFTYAGGFAAGNYVGLIIQEKFVKGTALIRVISGYDLSQLVEKLNEQSIKSTLMEGTTSEDYLKTHVMLIIIS